MRKVGELYGTPIVEGSPEENIENKIKNEILIKNYSPYLGDKPVELLKRSPDNTGSIESITNNSGNGKLPSNIVKIGGSENPTDKILYKKVHDSIQDSTELVFYIHKPNISKSVVMFTEGFDNDGIIMLFCIYNSIGGESSVLGCSSILLSTTGPHDIIESTGSCIISPLAPPDTYEEINGVLLGIIDLDELPEFTDWDSLPK